MLADALAGRPEARLAAASAAFCEALGWPLAREIRLRAWTREGHLIAEARSERWAEQLRAMEPEILLRMNTRLGGGAACRVEVRVGSWER